MRYSRGVSRLALTSLPAALGAALVLLLGACGGPAPTRPTATPASSEPPRPARPDAVLPVAAAEDLELLGFTPDGLAVVAAGFDNVYVFDARTGVVRATYASRGVSALDGFFVLRGGQVWDLRSDEHADLQLEGPLESAVRGPGSNEVTLVQRVARSDDRIVVVDLEAADARVVHEAADVRSVEPVDERRLLVGLDSDSYLFDLESGQVGTRFGSGAVALSPSRAAVIRTPRGLSAVVQGLDGAVLHEADLSSLHEAHYIHWVRPRIPQRVAGVFVFYTYLGGAQGEREFAWDASAGELRDEAPPRYVAPFADTESSYRVTDRCALELVEQGRATRLVGGGETRVCAASMLAPHGSRVAVTLGADLFVFDVGERPSEPAVRGTSLEPCVNGAVDSSLDEGLVVWRDERSIRAGGCSLPDMEYEGPEVGNGGHLGGSEDGAWAVESDGAPSEDDNDYESGVIVSGPGGRFALDESFSVGCIHGMDTAEELGWYHFTDCSGDAAVANDGSTAAIAGAEVRVVELRGASDDAPPPTILHARGDAPRYLTDDVLVTSRAIVHIPERQVIDSAAEVLVSADDTHAVAVTERGLTIATTSPFAWREVARPDVAEERWGLSRDGSTLVRLAPPGPVTRVVVTTGRLLPASPHVTTHPLRPEHLSADASHAVTCERGALWWVRLDDGERVRLGPNERCASLYALVLGERAAVVGGAPIRLFAVSGQLALTLEPVESGGRDTFLAWTDDGRFWAPSRILRGLGIREGSGILTSAVTPASESERFDPRLMELFQVEPPS